MRGGLHTASEGIGDVKLTALIDKRTKVHFNIGVSLPAGSITKRGNVVTSLGTRSNLRQPYAMQLGSDTSDRLPAITYSGRKGNVGWGRQLRGTIRLGSNDEGYSLDDKAAARS